MYKASKSLGCWRDVQLSSRVRSNELALQQGQGPKAPHKGMSQSRFYSIGCPILMSNSWKNCNGTTMCHASAWDQAEAVPDSVRIAILTGQVACYTQITRRQEHYRQLVSRYGKRLCFSCASFGVGCSRKEDICHSQSFVPTVQWGPCRSRRRLKDLSQRNAFSKKNEKNAFLQKRKYILCNSTKMSLYFIHLYLHCTGIQKQSFRLNKNP